MNNNIFKTKSKENIIFSVSVNSLLLSLTAIFISVYVIYDRVVFLSLAITFGTMFYHFVMRLIVGYFVTKHLSPYLSPSSRWFRMKKAEKKLYKLLKVKKWKLFMPTASPENFSLKKHTPDEIAVTMCSSELVHELNIILSFLPLLLAIPFGKISVFIITSTLAALCDLPFVIMQRYNRPRLLRFAERQNSNK